MCSLYIIGYFILGWYIIPGVIILIVTSIIQKDDNAIFAYIPIINLMVAIAYLFSFVIAIFAVIFKKSVWLFITNML